MDDPDAIEIRIDGEIWTAFTDFELTIGVDSYSAVSFSAPFDYGRPEVRETFRPMRYRSVEIFIGGQKMMTGQMVGIVPSVTAKESSVQITAYSKPAQLIDNCPPESILPLEFNKLNFKQITERLAAPFGIDVGVLSGVEVGAAFERVKCEPDKKIQSFLVELTKQRGLVLTDDQEGSMLISRSRPPGNPVGHLVGQPLNSVIPTFDPQAYYGQITGFATKKSGKGGSRHTIQNRKYLGSNLRTMSFMLDDAESADIPFAVRSHMGRMFGNLVSYVIQDLPTWRDPKGFLWDRNETLLLSAPSAMVYGDVELLIRNVVFRRSSDSKTATLGLCLPGAFSGEEPDRLPWEEEN